MKTLRLNIFMLCSEADEKIPEGLKLPELIEYTVKYYENSNQEEQSIGDRWDTVIFSNSIERLRPYFIISPLAQC